jgi:hypothetical protein
MEEYIKGHYSAIYYEVLDEFDDMLNVGFEQTWEKIGSNDSSSSDRERIARYICDTPDLTKADYSDVENIKDIHIEWLKCKDFAVRIAKCFLAGRGNPENPILKDLEEALIDEWMHDAVWLCTDYYENYWKLISIKWRRIKAAFDANWVNYPFTSPYELMLRIVDENLTDPFTHWTSQKFKQFSQCRDKQMYKLLRKSYRSSLDNKEQKQLDKLLAEHSPNTWTGRLDCLCRLLADKGDYYIATRMRIRDEICDGKAKQNLKTHCDPKLNRYRTPSHSWINGRRERLS